MRFYTANLKTGWFEYIGNAVSIRQLSRFKWVVGYGRLVPTKGLIYNEVIVTTEDPVWIEVSSFAQMHGRS